MFKKRVLLIVLCIYIINNLNAQFSGGSGTVDDPYIITTWNELASISLYGGGKHFKLNNDLDYDNPNHYGGYIRPSTGWQPSAAGSSFDGNNKTISNLYIRGNNYSYYGLFGSVGNNGLIKNLNLDHCDIAFSYGNCGSIAAINIGGVISNCTNKNSKISGAGVNNHTEGRVGGIVGENNGIVENCTCQDNNFVILGSYSAAYCGGIAGLNSGTIDNCLGNNFSIDSNSGSSGGIAGNNTSTGNIKNCSVFGSLSYSHSGGGIVGSNSGNIDNCKNTSEITSNVVVGGIAGENNSVINSCVNYTNVSVNSAGAGQTISGGISGKGNGKIVSCINYGTIEASSGYYSSYAGGIAGTGGNIEKCYNFGNVISSVYRSGSNTYAATAYAGGIAGEAAAVSLCANSGNITARSSGDNVTSTSGGIAGSNESAVTCYNTGFIQSDGTKGAIAGSNPGSISNCYYLDLSCANGIGYGISQGTTVLTYTQMCHQNSYTNFDFTNTWEMQQGVPFPQLKGTVMEYVTKVSATPVQVSLNLTDSKSKTLTISVEPINKNPNNSFLYYLSADKNIATVEDDGTITAKNKGRTAVSVFSPHGGFKEEVDVLVDMIIKTPVTLNLSIPGKTYGDPSFAINATSSPQAGRINYTSNDPAILSIAGNTATIHKAGQATITAKVADDDPNYTSDAVQQTITVSPANISVIAKGGNSVYGETPINPGISATELKYGETADVLSGLTNSFGINSASPAGAYTLTVEGTLTNNNYRINQRINGTWAVSKALIPPANILWPSASPIKYGQTLNESVLSDGSAPVPGIFEFKYPALKPGVGINQQIVVFTPSDINYVQAEGLIFVTVNDNISGSEDGVLLGLLVDGQPINLIPGQTVYRYTASCGKSALGIVAASANATVTINNETGGSYNLNIPQAGNYPVNIVVSSSSGESTTYTLNVIRPFDNVLITRWDDVLSVINNPQNNGGYSFANYQWYKNDVLLSGETQGYIRETGGLSTSSSYHVALTTTTGIHAPSCPYTPSASNKFMSLKAYPNPAKDNQVIQVEVNLHDSEWPNAMLTLYDLQGRPVFKSKPVKGTNTITVPAGSYVLSLTAGNKPVASEKIIVEN